MHRRLLKELNQLQTEISPDWLVEQYNESDSCRWRLYLLGRRGTPYEKGVFKMSASFSSDYPFKRPAFKCDTKIFHPSICVDHGDMSISLFGNYNPCMPMRRLLQDIATAIYTPNEEDVLNSDAAFLYEHYPESFKKKATAWTEKFAIINSRDIASLRDRRILKEFDKLQSRIDSEWRVEYYYPNDSTRWRLYLIGRDGTAYDNGIFQLSVSFPSEYPFICPDFLFDTKIFHPSVDENGRMSTSFFSDFHPHMSMCDLLKNIASAIYIPNEGDVLNSDAASLYKYDRESFKTNTAIWVSQYAVDDEIISNTSFSLSSSKIVSDRTCRNYSSYDNNI